MNSPQIEAALAEWSKGYTPTEWAQRHFRSNFRIELETALARLILLAEGEGDELAISASVQSFAAHVARMDERLRRDLAGDRYVDTGKHQRPATNARGTNAA
ncbi:MULTISPECIES: hypothetical protein [Nocardia]|uniref:hypothetical protein n=1 Tax=Nocardia TaxID=1817 RepID=UPI0013007847|nr:MULTISPECIES: hypothetical protein [Nocardia]